MLGERRERAAHVGQLFVIQGELQLVAAIRSGTDKARLQRLADTLNPELDRHTRFRAGHGSGKHRHTGRYLLHPANDRRATADVGLRPEIDRMVTNCWSSFMVAIASRKLRTSSLMMSASLVR